MKIFLSLAFFCSVAAMADTSSDIIDGARKSIQVESMVQAAIAKCDIQASGSAKSLISFGMPCETYLNNANSVLVNFPDRKESKNLRRKIVDYAISHHVKLDQRFISDL